MNEELTFVVGQIPKMKLRFNVTDETTVAALSLSDYTGAQVLVFGPDGVLRATMAATITDSANGKVESVWDATSPFDEPGDYRIQLKLTNGSAADYTTTHRAVVKELGV
ncbi:hypothetical protein [Streptomyces sp. NPDC020141]|uniref:hypothetical protein n=1 Tax=Streptomyces sp. NPDC020141 TaxID=3365065 RepID=UPI0037A5C825